MAEFWGGEKTSQLLLCMVFKSSWCQSQTGEPQDDTKRVFNRTEKKTVNNDVVLDFLQLKIKAERPSAL